MILCNTVCSTSSVGAGTSTKTGSPLVSHRYTPSGTSHLQHWRHQLGLCGQLRAQGDGQPGLANSYPLAHWHVRDDVVDQLGRRLGPAPGPARPAKASALAAA